MLPGQVIQNAVEGEPFRLDFCARLGDAHFVLFADGDGGVFLAEFDEHEAAAGFQRAVDAAEHLLRQSKLMIDIDEQGKVKRFRGQAGIGFRAEDRLDVGEPLAADALVEQADHLGLDVGGVHFSGRTDGFREQLRVVSRAGTDIGDGLARLETKEPDSQTGALLHLSFGALEPGCAGRAHHWGDEPAAHGVAEGLGSAGGGEEKKYGGQLRERPGFDMFHTDTDSEATRMYAAFRGFFTAAAAGLVLLSGAACGTRKADTVHPMGTPVTVGDLSYTIYNTEWRDELQTDMGPRKPQHRFLLVTMSVTNNGPEDLTAPLLAVIDKDGRETLELDKGEGVAQWMGLLRRVRSTQTDTGVLLFDVPPGDYKLRVSSGGDVDHEQTALIHLPYRVEAPESRPVVEPQMPPAQ